MLAFDFKDGPESQLLVLVQGRLVATVGLRVF